MNTALSWIKAYVPDLDVTAQEYTDAMTLTGTKVEGYTCLDKNLEKIVVGEILEVKGHPDADKLVVCQVNVGEGEPLRADYPGADVLPVFNQADTPQEAALAGEMLEGMGETSGAASGQLDQDGSARLF